MRSTDQDLPTLPSTWHLQQPALQVLNSNIFISNSFSYALLPLTAVKVGGMRVSQANHPHLAQEKKVVKAEMAAALDPEVEPEAVEKHRDVKVVHPAKPSPCHEKSHPQKQNMNINQPR